MDAQLQLLEEVLDAEVTVDIGKLREAARRGVPPKYRPTLYRYFLGVTSTDKSGEMSSSQWQGEGFEALLSSKFVQSSAFHRNDSISFLPSKGAFVTRLTTDSSRRTRFLRVVDALRVSHTFVEDRKMKAFVSIASVLESIFSGPSGTQDIYYCTEAIISLLQHGKNYLSSEQQLQEDCSLLLTLLRTINRELYTHFFHEGVQVFDWAPNMLLTLLGEHLHPEDLFDIWDHYLNEAMLEMGFPLHLYVCLSLLDQFSERLMEMDRVEILAFLSHFPRLNVERVLTDARRLKERVRSKGLV